MEVQRVIIDRKSEGFKNLPAKPQSALWTLHDLCMPLMNLQSQVRSKQTASGHSGRVLFLEPLLLNLAIHRNKSGCPEDGVSEHAISSGLWVRAGSSMHPSMHRSWVEWNLPGQQIASGHGRVLFLELLL